MSGSRAGAARRAKRTLDMLRLAGEDTVRAARTWHPPEVLESPAPPRRVPRARRPEPTWGRTPAAQVARHIVQDRALFPLLTALGRPEVIGGEHLLAARAPVIVAPNHASHSDAALVLQALPRHLRDHTLVPAAADYFFDRRALSVLVTLAMNAVPFDRVDEIADSVRRCERYLRHGYSIVLFPEGSRSRDGRLRGFKAGVAHLAVQTGAPVLPVFIHGSHRLLARGRALPRPAQVVVQIGAPIRALPHEHAKQFNARLERAVQDLGEAARSYSHRDTPPAPQSWLSLWRASAPPAAWPPGLRGATEPAGGADDTAAPSVAQPATVASAPPRWIDAWRSATPR